MLSPGWRSSLATGDRCYMSAKQSLITLHCSLASHTDQYLISLYVFVQYEEDVEDATSRLIKTHHQLFTDDMQAYCSASSLDDVPAIISLLQS